MELFFVCNKRSPPQLEIFTNLGKVFREKQNSVGSFFVRQLSLLSPAFKLSLDTTRPTERVKILVGVVNILWLDSIFQTLNFQLVPRVTLFRRKMISTFCNFFSEHFTSTEIILAEIVLLTFQLRLANNFLRSRFIIY